jgi:hypothetical protein
MSKLTISESQTLARRLRKSLPAPFGVDAESLAAELALALHKRSQNLEHAKRVVQRALDNMTYMPTPAEIRTLAAETEESWGASEVPAVATCERCEGHPGVVYETVEYRGQRIEGAKPCGCVSKRLPHEGVAV